MLTPGSKMPEFKVPACVSVEKGKEFKEKSYKEDKKPKRVRPDVDDAALGRAADGELSLVNSRAVFVSVAVARSTLFTRSGA